MQHAKEKALDFAKVNVFRVFAAFKKWFPIKLPTGLRITSIIQPSFSSHTPRIKQH